LREPGSFAKICKALGDHEDERVMHNKAIDVLVNRIWDLIYWKILSHGLVAYLTFFCSFLNYMLIYFRLESGD